MFDCHSPLKVSEGQIVITVSSVDLRVFCALAAQGSVEVTCAEWLPVCGETLVWVGCGVASVLNLSMMFTASPFSTTFSKPNFFCKCVNK